MTERKSSKEFGKVEESNDCKNLSISESFNLRQRIERDWNRTRKTQGRLVEDRDKRIEDECRATFCERERFVVVW
eukprot:scaffold4884_cov165-Amphora_coffeaeformis.AAC.13